MSSSLCFPLALVAALLCSVVRTGAVTLGFDVSADKFTYANAADGAYGGASDKASTFAIIGTTDEDRLSTMLLIFDTASLGSIQGSYQITGVRLKLTVLTGGVFAYDPTPDSFRTLLASTDSLYQPDTDAGRPIEVFGVGLRNGYTRLISTPEASPSSPGYGEYSAIVGANGQRNVFPLGRDAAGNLYDASDNVSQGKEAYAFGVGTTTQVTPGSLVPQGAQFTFELQLSASAVRSYISGSLASGTLGLMVSSLHPVTGQNSPDSYPRYFTREGGSIFPSSFGFTPRLEVDYVIVPEPGISILLLLGFALVVTSRAIRNRHHLS